MHRGQPQRIVRQIMSGEINRLRIRIVQLDQISGIRSATEDQPFVDADWACGSSSPGDVLSAKSRLGQTAPASRAKAPNGQIGQLWSKQNVIQHDRSRSIEQEQSFTIALQREPQII